jgi:hypothetical protein
LDAGFIVLEYFGSEGVGILLIVVGVYYLFQSIKVVVHFFFVLSHRQTIFKKPTKFLQSGQ